MPTIRWQAKNSEVVVQAIEKQTRAQNKQKETFKESAREATKLDRAAQQIVKNNEQPLERYKRRMQELGQIMATNRGITRDLAEREMRRLRQELERADPQLRKVAQANARLREEAARASAELARQGQRIRRDLETPLERYKRELMDLGRVYRAGQISQELFVRGARKLKSELLQTQVAAAGVRREVNANAIAGRLAFGAPAARQLAGMVTGWASVATAVTVATSAVSAYNQEKNKAADDAQAGRRSASQLAQLAVTQSNTPEGRRAAQLALENEAKRYYGLGAGESLEDSNNLTFKLNSASLNERDRGQLARAQASGLIGDAGSFSSGIAAFKSSFKDLSADQLLSKGLAVSRVSPSEANQLIEEVAKSGAQLKTLGFSEDFGLAAGAILSRTFKGASEGATRLDSFARNFERYGLQNDPSLRGLSGLDVIDEIARRDILGNRAELEKLVGNRNEAIQGVRDLVTNRAELRQLAGESAEAGRINLAREAGRLVNQDPVNKAARQANLARRKRELERIGQSDITNDIRAIRDARVTERRESAPGFGTEVQNVAESTGFFFSELFFGESLRKQKNEVDQVFDKFEQMIHGLETISQQQRRGRQTTNQE